MSDWLVDNPFFYKNMSFFIDYFDWITIFVAALFIIGVLGDKPASFLAANFAVKVLLAIYLIYRFNGYRKHMPTLTDLDRKICYSAGVYILVFSFLDIIQSYVERLRNMVDPYTVPIVKSLKNLVINLHTSSNA
jgi:hypothetical protein